MDTAQRHLPLLSYRPRSAVALSGVGLTSGWRPPAPRLTLRASVVTSALTARTDHVALAETGLGRWMLVQADPTNVAMRAVGLVALVRGLSKHSATCTVLGLGLAVVARARDSIGSRSARPAHTWSS